MVLHDPECYLHSSLSSIVYFLLLFFFTLFVILREGEPQSETTLLFSRWTKDRGLKEAVSPRTGKKILVHKANTRLLYQSQI